MKKKLYTHIATLFGVNAPETPKKGSDLAQLNQIDNAYLAVEDGNIVDFGKMEDLQGITDWTDLEVIDFTGKSIFPSYCDSHTHLVFAKSREEEFVYKIKGLSYQEIAAKGGGIINSALKLRDASEDELYEKAATRLRKLIALGTGAIEIKSGYGLSLDSELKMLRVVARLKKEFPIPVKATLLAAHAVPPEYKDRKDEYLQLIIDQILPAVNEEQLANFIDIFVEENYFTVADMELLLTAAQKYDLRPKVHVNQFTSLGGIEAAQKYNALSVDHLEEMSEKDLDVLKQSNIIATALPSCSFYLKIPYAPARTLIENNAALCLATDFNPGSTPSGNMNFVWSLACIQQKLLPEEAFNAMSINGAFAMDLQNEVGSIDIGKRANFFTINNLPSLAYIPYSFGENLIDEVYINGELWS